jgi:hypothetical protein
MRLLRAILCVFVVTALVASTSLALAAEATADRHCAPTVAGDLYGNDPSTGQPADEHCTQHCQTCVLTPIIAPTAGHAVSAILTTADIVELLGRSISPPLSPPIA